jgi:membrane protein YqaA with SNARE-associated domain
MRLFGRLYDATLRAAQHRHAQWYLAINSVAEATFFPIPPDVMLVPMTLAQPARWWRLAALTTATSVLGGVLGYLIGYYLLDVALPVIDDWGYRTAYDTAVGWFEHYGFWAILAAGFTPIPFKVFTISAGAAQMHLLPFVVGAAIGRGGRFFLVAAAMRWFGPRFEPQLKRYVDVLGWATLGAIVVGVGIWKALRVV